MNRFLLKFVIASLPVLLFLVLLEFHARSNDHSANYYKKSFIEENNNKIEGVILGPSHILRGVHPKYLKHKVASLAQSGSSPNVDFLLFEYVLEQTTPKFILLDLSVGYLSRHNSQDWIEGVQLPYYYKNIAANFFNKWFFISYPFKKHLKLNQVQKLDNWGLDIEIKAQNDIFTKLSFQDSLILKSESTKRILDKHKRKIEANRLPENQALYHRIITKCKALDIKVIFVSPPKYHIYNSNLNDKHSKERAAFLKNIVDEKSVFFLNYEAHYEIMPHYFYNINHLNLKGAEVFSTKLNKDLLDLL